MPRYEYQCEACGIRFERFQSFNDEPLKECIECQGRVRRVVYPAGIIFKGSGFYVTDNRPAEAKSDSDGGIETSVEAPKKETSPKDK